MFIEGADEEGVIRVNIVALSTSGGHRTRQDFIMRDECFDQGRGGILNRMAFEGVKSKTLIDRRCCVYEQKYKINPKPRQNTKKGH